MGRGPARPGGAAPLNIPAVEPVRLEQRESFITADGSAIRELAGVPSGNAANQSLAEATVPPGGETAEHYHRVSEEIYFFLSGAGTMRLGDEEAAVRGGDCVVIPPGRGAQALQPGHRAARPALLLRPRVLARGHRPHRAASSPATRSA